MPLLCRCYYRRVRIAVPIALLLAAASSCGQGSADARPEQKSQASSGRPNIVVFMADDLGMADLSFLGGQPHTPNIDQLAASGIRLSNFRAMPLCTPSRAAFLTGRSPARYGLAWSPLPPWSTLGLPQEEVTLAEQLSTAGYRTALLGKWHLGHSKAEHHPHNHGFDYFYGCLNGSVGYWQRKARGGGLDWQRNGESVAAEGYTTHLIADEAQQLIETHDFDAPLFLFVSFTAPHQPLQAPDAAKEAYADIEDPSRRVYCAMVSEMDKAIGQVLSALEQREQAQNSLILFVSDNGGARDQGGANQPYRAGKGSVFEGGIKVPAVLNWPGRQPAVEFTDFTTILDLAPTFCEAAGIDPDVEFDGRSLLPSLPTIGPDGKVKPPSNGLATPGAMFFASTADRVQAAYLEDGYKYVRRAARPERPMKEFMFFLPDDPLEKQNLIEGEAERASTSRDHLAELLGTSATSLDLNQIAPAKAKEPANWQAPEDWSKLD